jgi:hypothetical protein
VTGSKVLPKVVGILLTLALLTMVVRHPTDAAEWARALGTWVGDAADGIAIFLRNISG